METIYNKKTLSEDERAALGIATQALIDGNRLYGINKEDVSHVEYALGLALATLTRLYKGPALATLIELGLDEDGFSISFLTSERST